MSDDKPENKDAEATAPSIRPPLKLKDSSSGVADPMALRNTNTGNLKALKIRGDASATVPANPNDPQPGPDTIKLKVIREKKKTSANLMAASQTIHLKTIPPPGAKPAADAASGAGEEDAPAKKTLVVQLPDSAKAGGEKTNTSTLARPQSGASIPAVPGVGPTVIGSAQKKAGATLKIKPPPTPGTQETATTAIKRPEAGLPPPPSLDAGPPKLKLSAPPVGAQTVQTEPPPAASEDSSSAVQPTGKMTLKIKPVPPSASAAKTISAPLIPGVTDAEPKAKSTVSLEAPPEAKATVQIPAEEAPAAKKKKLTLTRGKSTVAAAPPPDGAGADSSGESSAAAPVKAQAAIRPQDYESETGAEPGIGYLLAAVASLIAMGGLTALLVIQYMRHLG